MTKAITDTHTQAFASQKLKYRYWIMLALFSLLGLIFAVGLIFYDNPVPPSSPSFVPVLQGRLSALLTMVILAFCHSLATLTFQSVVSNRVVTPSIMGFDSVYNLIHTSTLFFFGSYTLVQTADLPFFLLQIAVMVVFCLILYGYLLKRLRGDLHTVLLLGIVIGSSLNSLSVFMRRMLSPSEFDLLQAQLFGSVNHAESSYFLPALILIAISVLALFYLSPSLDVLSLGRPIARNLGIDDQKATRLFLIIISVLMAVATALAGSLTFYGFLAAHMAYQLADTPSHRHLFMMGLASAFLIITGAYFIMYHVYDAQGVVSIIIELGGGLTFLIVILRRRKL